MDFDHFLTGSKWTILQEIGKKKQSASEIAQTLKTSIANISQQLKLLEAYGIIKKEKTINEKKPGKPKTNYCIKKEQTFIIKMQKNAVKKIALKPFWGHDIFLNTIDLPNNLDAYYITKFCFFTDDILKYVDSLAYLKTTKDSLELILITKQLDKIRKEYSNITLKHPAGDKKKIICWSHNEEELTKGITHKERYFLDLTKEFIPIFDKTGALERIKEVREQL